MSVTVLKSSHFFSCCGCKVKCRRIFWKFHSRWYMMFMDFLSYKLWNNNNNNLTVQETRWRDWRVRYWKESVWRYYSLFRPNQRKFLFHSATCSCIVELIEAVTRIADFSYLSSAMFYMWISLKRRVHAMRPPLTSYKYIGGGGGGGWPN